MFRITGRHFSTGFMRLYGDFKGEFSKGHFNRRSGIIVCYKHDLIVNVIQALSLLMQMQVKLTNLWIT